MARNPNHERIAAVYQAVRCYPGERPGFIARLLGLHSSQVTRLLPALGIDPAALKPGPNLLQPVLHVRAILNPNTGQPRKVIGLAGLAASPAGGPSPAAPFATDDIPF